VRNARAKGAKRVEKKGKKEKERRRRPKPAPFNAKRPDDPSAFRPETVL
jgi:hypothetical protein